MLSSSSFIVGDWAVEPDLDQISRGGEQKTLRPQVMNLLIYLAERDGQLCRFEDLFTDLWPNKVVSDATLYNCIAELRHKLDEGADGAGCIQTIPKKGYRLLLPISGLENAGVLDQPESLNSNTHSASRWPVLIFAAILALSFGYFLTDRLIDESVLGPGGEISETRVSEAAQVALADLYPKSVAVLPFVNRSFDPQDEYFSDGLSDTLRTIVSNLPNLTVPSRTSSIFFKGQDISVQEIAAALGVSKVLSGTVQRAGNTIRVTAELVEAGNGYSLWSKSYNREMSDIFAMQDDIANSVALALEVTLASGGRIDTAGTDNTTAYLKYLQGRQQMRTGSHASLARAALSLKEALALDPDYYAAKRALADTYWRHGSIGLIQRSEATELVMPLLVRLLEERPNDGLVLALAARVRGYAAIDVEQHYAELLAAIERAPNESRLYPRIAFVLTRMHRQEEAIEWLDRAIVLDPLNARLHFTRANYLVAAGDLDWAETAYARAIELNPADPNFYGHAIEIDWRRKQYDQWFAIGRQGMEVDPLDYEFPTYYALNFYTFGLMDEGDKYLQRAVAVAPEAATVKAAQLYRLVFRGEYERAREMSETLLREGIDDRRAAHWFVVMVFVSTMIDIDQADAALAVLEELSPGVTSPGFIPANLVQRALQYYAILIQAQAQGEIAPLIVLETMLEEMEQAFPGFEHRPSLAAPVAMARGQQELAVELALEDLDGRKNFIEAWDWPLRYRHIYFYKALAQDPAVAKRLKELEEEAKKGGEDIWNYIVQHDLQL